MHFIPIKFSDPDFDPAYTAGFQLLIILNQQYFSYAVRHPVSQRLVFLSTHHPLTQLFELQGRAELLNSAYQKVIIGLETNSFCLIPDAVFTTENMADFAAFLSVKEADVVVKDQIENGDNTVIFTFPEQLISKLASQFNTTDFKFAPKGWIKTVLQQQPAGQKLYLFLADNQLQVLYPDQKNIRFYNQFSCSSPDELIYYTGLVSNQLKLNQHETSLVVCGFVEPNSKEMLRLREFFKEVNFFTTNTGFKQQPALQHHQVVDFLGLY